MRYIILFLLLVSCAAATPATPMQPTRITVGADQCQAAQVHLQVLACPDGNGGKLGDPNKHGQSFTVLCENLYIQGIDFQAPCFVAATNCTEVASCRP